MPRLTNRWGSPAPRRPFTKLHNDMLVSATEQFWAEESDGCDADWTISDGNGPQVLGGSFDECVRRDDTLVLLEMSIHDLMQVRGPPPPPFPAPERM